MGPQDGGSERPGSFEVVLDHLLVELISVIRQSFDDALLERQAVEERFQVDVFLGDVSWETSYSLPGEEQPPRVRADLSVDWPTWSQTAYRTWSIGETPDELPEAVVEVALRLQRLAEEPPADKIVAALSPDPPTVGGEPLVRSGVTIEQLHAGQHPEGEGEEPPTRWAVEASFEGSVRFEEAHLEDPSTVEPLMGALARWVASNLVRLADLPFSFLPPDPDHDT